LDLDDVGQPQPEIDDLDLIPERVAAAVATERGRVLEAVEVEVVQGEDGGSIRATDRVDQFARGGDGQAFVRHAEQVETVGEVDRLPQGGKAFLLDVENCAITASRAYGLDLGIAEARFDGLRLLQLRQIIIHL